MSQRVSNYSNHSEAYISIMKKREVKRVKAARRRCRFAVKFSAALCLILTCAFLFGSSTLYAKNDHPTVPTYKYYTSISIEQGDTLSSIAKAYISTEYSSIDEYISEVKFINHIDGDNIIAGNHIIVPYYSEEIK